MRLRTLLTLFSISLTSCGEPLDPPLPPLLQGASSTGGSNFLCEPDLVSEGVEGTTPDTVSHSTEIVGRLNSAFPRGSLAKLLRQSLADQGFEIHDACSPDGSVSFPIFRQRGGNGITSYPAFGTVFWREDELGRLVWSTGDIAFTGL